MYGHSADLCREAQLDTSLNEVDRQEPKVVKPTIHKSVKEENIGLWMLVEC